MVRIHDEKNNIQKIHSFQDVFTLFLLNPRFSLCCMIVLLCFLTGCRGEYITVTERTHNKDGDYDHFHAVDVGPVRAHVYRGYATYTYFKDDYRNPDVERMNPFEEQLKFFEEQLKLSCGDAKISLKEKECSPPNSCDSRIICS